MAGVEALGFQHSVGRMPGENGSLQLHESLMCYIFCSTMKTTTVRELRNNYSKVLKWVSAGQEVQVTRRGKVVAKVVLPDEPSLKVDWSQSAALRITAADKILTARQSERLLKEAQGNC